MASFYEDASLVVIPSGYKTSKIYAEKPTDGSGDLTFTRASGATRVGPNGLIEKVRTNLILQSQDFSTAWSANSCTVATNTTANPLDGAVNADTITFTGGTTQKYVIQAFSFNGNYTVSAYLKAGTNQFVQFLLGSDAGLYANFDLVNGTASATGSTATIVAAGNGWFRCSMSFTSTTGTHVFIQAVDSLAATRFDTTSSTGTLIAFGYQLETGDIATDYIPTTTAAVSVGPVSNVPRLDYLGSSCPRLLLEPQRTNLVTYSEQFDNAAWSKSGNGTGSAPVVTANNSISPDGTMNADTVVFNSGAGTTASDFSSLFQTFGGTTAIYTVSFYAKTASGTAQVQVRIDGSLYDKLTITDEWQRFTLTKSLTGTSNVFEMTIRRDLNEPINASATIQLWGVQVELGAYATSYIPTLGASVTRVADAASKTGISSLIGQTEGTIFIEVNFQNIDQSPGPDILISLNNGTTDNEINILLDTPAGANKTLLAYVRNAAANEAVIYGASPITATKYKIAISYKLNDIVFYANGLQIGTDTSATIPATSNLSYTSRSDGSFSNTQQEYLQQSILFKTRLTNAQLAELTTL